MVAREKWGEEAEGPAVECVRPPTVESRRDRADRRDHRRPSRVL